MDYNSGYGDEQLPPSDYVVETVDDDRRNGGSAAVDTGGMQMKQSIDHRHSSSSSMSSPGKLFVGGVSWETTEETFANYFEKFGEVVDSVIMRDRMTGKPRGFGFVTYADSAVAEKVLEEEHVIDDRKVDLKRTVPRGDRDTTDIKPLSKTRKIFVGGLPPHVEEDELKKYFCVYGEIIEHQIMYDHHTGRSRGFGFVTFLTEDSLDRLFSDGKVHEFGDKQVDIKRAEPKRTGRDNSFRSYGASGKYDQEDCYGGQASEDYNMYGGYGGYGGYGAYAGNSMVNAAGFYGYGGGYGYGYGYGYGGQMFNPGYGAGGYSNMGGGYGVAAAAAYGGGNGNGSSSSGRGSGSNGLGPGRYHPYQK
ncbi:RNA-binding [Hirschfeldia incana]|nr:RNA-binding [Hirschfeldia incana]KAJ0257251.1 RNA-binding [Hirschfeldia incana]